MLFSSPQFFVFFSIYLVCHLLFPARLRIWLIIVGSTVFYGWWNPVYVGLPFLMSLIAFAGARVVGSAKDPIIRRRLLAVGLILLFTPLAVVKYTNFFYLEIVGLFLKVAARPLDISLPLGISFITFTLAAYMIDVYRGTFPQLRSASWLFGYVLFFPHLIAGPILRPRELIPQLQAHRPALDAKFLLGLVIFSVGLVKKTVVADQMIAVVEPAFVPGAVVDGWAYILAIYGFSTQIYCDFSGYTDMAVGLAYMLRIRLPTNFRMPYLSASPIEFWRRWHITLSRWLRDYLYIPLGGARNGNLAKARNLMLTMVLGGLWHGANWSFILWGVLHGVALVLAHAVRDSGVRLRLPRFLAVFLMFHFVTAAWVFFRAPDIRTAIDVLVGVTTVDVATSYAFASGHVFELLVLTLFFLSHRYDRHELFRLAVRKVPKAVLIPAIGLAWMLAATISQGSSAKFIYFDF